MNGPDLLAGVATEFEADGRTYYLGVADYELELYFQARHEAWVRNRIEATAGMVAEAVTRADVDSFNRMRAANQFAFGSQLSIQWLLSDEGFTEYVLLLSGKGRKEQGGPTLGKEALRGMRRAERETWDGLVRVVLRRDFPNLMKDEASSEATPPPTTSESSNSSVVNPGSWAAAKSSAFPTSTSPA